MHPATSRFWPTVAAVSALTLRAVAQAPSEAPPVQLEEATIADLHGAMLSGLLTAEGLAARYLERINAYDQTGPAINSIIAVNPSLLAEARQRDRSVRQGVARGPLFGIPVLLKDNVDALPMATTAGSLALALSMPPDDAFIANRLRAAGAVVLGKATLTEFANFMASGMPSGYSSLGGHGLNPYDPRVRANGQAWVTPGGSSSGPGIATAANLATVSIGTETSGSILSPSSANGIVGIKPTLGLVSRDGIVPITADQDTAGPMARTVTDAAIVLGVIAGHDPSDPATAACLTPGNCFSDYTQFLDRTALQGARIAVPSFQLGSEGTMRMQDAMATMRAGGAQVVFPYNIQGLGQLGGICVTYPPPGNQSTVLIYGMKRDLDNYLAGLGAGAPMQSLAQIIAFNSANAAAALLYGQSILVAADQYDTTPGSADEMRYLADRQNDLTVSRGSLDAVYAGPDGQAGTADDFDAILFPSNTGANAPARAGYPSIAVPGGFIVRSGQPSVPFCVTLSGPAFSEPRLIALAYAFEQATGLRAPPASTPPLPTDTIPLSLPRVVPVGPGCSGAGGVPALANIGSPILANSAFGMSLSSVRPSAPAFLAVSVPGSALSIGGCVVNAVFPWPVVLGSVSSASGDAEFDLPLPWGPVLSGQTLRLQGGALDPAGAGLGVVALSGSLDVTIGG